MMTGEEGRGSTLIVFEPYMRSDVANPRGFRHVLELRVAIAGRGKHHEQRLRLHLLALASRVLLIHRCVSLG